MAKIRPLLVPEQPVPVLLLLDTGARRDELMSRTLADLDQDLDVLLVLGKGRRERALP